MSTVLEYLRRGFDVLENIPKDDFDNLLEQIRLYQMSSSEHSDKLGELIAQTSYFYSLTGTKLSQIYAIKCSIKRQLDKAKQRIAKQLNIPLSKKAEIDRACVEDENIQQLSQNYEEVEAIELFFSNMRESLYMSHYALRKEVESSGRSGSQRSRIYHGA